MRVLFGLVFKSILLIFIGIFIYELPFLFQEVKFMIKPFDSYQVSTDTNQVLDTGSSRIIKPKNLDYGIVVPKIGINSSIAEEFSGLTEEVYHVKQSANPGTKGQAIFKTYQTSDELINRKNSIYYLLHRMIPDDEIYIFYKDKQYIYKVKEVRIVNSKEHEEGLDTLYSNSIRIDVNWPPGFYSSKLIVYATLSD